MRIFNSILHVVSEKKIFEISANQRLLWSLAATFQSSSREPLKQMGPNVAGMIFCIGYPTWLPGAITASDWLKFLMIFFSDTTWRMELKIVMKDHCKLLTLTNFIT
jgi:hypothetical protein